MSNRGRIEYQLIIVASVMLGSCMENTERVGGKNLAAEANQNALRALRQGKELEARLQRVEEQLKNRTAASSGNSS